MKLGEIIVRLNADLVQPLNPTIGVMQNLGRRLMESKSHCFSPKDISELNRQVITVDFHSSGLVIASMDVVGEIKYAKRGTGWKIKLTKGRTKGLRTWLTVDEPTSRKDIGGVDRLGQGGTVHLKIEETVLTCNVFFEGPDDPLD